MLARWRVPTGPATHVLMDGGILCVPPEETRDFYQACIDLINLGTKLYVVEQKTEVFKFFVDLDYKAKEKLSDDDLLQFCSIIHECVGEGRCLIAKARPRPIADGLIKSGVHIHWPDVTVTRTQALNLRTKIIANLGDGPWDTVIDASVYGGSGLRMLWSHKKPTGDPYLPWRQLGGPEFSKEPNVDVMELFAVRTDETPRATETLENVQELEEFIQRYMMGQRRARIKKVQRHEHDGWFVQTDSKFCEKIRAEHRSNHVWFSVTAPGRISQRCFNEECREFKGDEVILPPSLVEQLNVVDIAGSPSHSFIMDVFPNGERGAIPSVRETRPQVFRSFTG